MPSFEKNLKAAVEASDKLNKLLRRLADDEGVGDSSSDDSDPEDAE